MIRIRLDLGALEQWPSDRLGDFTDRLLSAYPGLQEHGCSYGVPGGFVRRLREGTWLGHVAEHVALELQSLVGARVSRGKTRSVKGRPGVYDVMYAYNDELIGLLAGRLALESVNALLPTDLQSVDGLDVLAEPPFDGPFAVPLALESLRRMAREVALGPTTASIVREARRRDIPFFRIDDSSLVQLGQGSLQKRIRAGVTGYTSEIAGEIASDKELSKALLRDAGLPVPESILVRSADEAVEAAEQLRFPVVTKPLDGNHGRGVMVGLASPDEVRWGFEYARAESRAVLIEKHLEGRDHRILVINGEVAAVAERVPASVTGNGVLSVAELIQTANLDPRRGEGHNDILTRISVDDCVIHYLKRSGISLDTVPPEGERVLLRPTANLSTGGTAIDRTDDIHPFNRYAAVRAAKLIGLDIAGIDFITPDISRSVLDVGGAIVEVNAGPGFRMHLHPSEGRPRNVARNVLDMLFPAGSRSRIPIFAVTGTNGKSTTCRMLAHILSGTGASVGLACSTGIYVDGVRQKSGDASGPQSARSILRDPNVGVAVLETARGGILREGLGFDICDFGAVLNVKSDHLGMKGIETLDELAAVKSVVVETVRRGGCSLLNADDPLCASMAKDAGGRVAYFSTKPKPKWPDFLTTHVNEGGLAATLETGQLGAEILIHDNQDQLYLMRVSDIPATMGGLAMFNTENAMAAAVLAFAHDIPLALIRQQLASFGTSFEQSPGRLNMREANGVSVILDYAHNVHGLAALGGVVTAMKNERNWAIGLIGVPGDRRDCDIREMGALASTIFDELVLREDEDLRGRVSGDVAALLLEGALSAGFPRSKVRIILDEAGAVEACLENATPGSLIVILADDIERSWRQVLAFKGPTSGASEEITPSQMRMVSAG